MGYCKLECPDGEAKCCIYCTKQDSCQHQCDMMERYEYAEDCKEYVKEDEPWLHSCQGLRLEESYSEWLVLYVQRSCTTSTTQTIRKENGMLTRNKKLKDYGIPADDIEKLNTMLKDFPAEYEYLLTNDEDLEWNRAIDCAVKIVEGGGVK